MKNISPIFITGLKRFGTPWYTFWKHENLNIKNYMLYVITSSWWLWRN